MTDEMSQFESSMASGKIKIHKPKPLRNKNEESEEEKWFQANWGLNLLCVFMTFCVLYALYCGFFILWLSMLSEYGNQLLWFFFGLFLTSFGGMASFAMYSMSKQEIGWWATENRSEEEEPCCGEGYFCGYEAY